MRGLLDRVLDRVEREVDDPKTPPGIVAKHGELLLKLDQTIPEPVELERGSDAWPAEVRDQLDRLRTGIEGASDAELREYLAKHDLAALRAGVEPIGGRDECGLTGMRRRPPKPRSISPAPGGEGADGRSRSSLTP